MILSDITSKLPDRKGYWSHRFSDEKKQAFESRERRRKRAEEERKRYAPNFVDSSSVTCFVDREREIEPTPYLENIYGPRSSLCSICNEPVNSEGEKDGDKQRFCCDLCPAVAHTACAQRSEDDNDCLLHNLGRFTKQYRNHLTKKLKTGDVWCCRLCSKEILASLDAEKARLGLDRFKRLAFFSALRLQANCLRHKARSRYKTLYNGIVRLQARCRGAQMRQSFMTELATTHRSFRIKNCDFALAPGIPISDSKSNISCIVCIINDESNDLEDSERQMYRFDTHGIAQQSGSGRWNDSFTVYSCNTMVKLAFTLHAKENETSSTRSIFLGQYVIDARRLLTKSFFSGKPTRIKGDLQSIDVEPRDQRFSFLKTEDSPLSSDAFGKLSFEVQPFSLTESKCGVIEEILSTVLKGARKKWHAVLADKCLYLFSQYGDARPKVTIHLSYGSHVGWYNETEEHNNNNDKHMRRKQKQSFLDSKIIKVSSLNNETWLFSCANTQQLEAWHNKLTGTYKKTLQAGAKKFKANEKFV